jgi:hypothetical protein
VRVVSGPPGARLKAKAAKSVIVKTEAGSSIDENLTTAVFRCPNRCVLNYC